MKKALLVTVIIMALGGVSFFAYQQWLSSSPSENPAGVDEPERTINYDPPTEEEKEAGNESKQELIEEETNKSTASVVDVGVAYAGQSDDEVEVDAFIQGVIEGGGTCTATFRRNSGTVRATSVAFVDATTTQCRNISIDRSRFPTAGDWTLVVSYQSDDYSGSSEELTVSIN